MKISMRLRKDMMRMKSKKQLAMVVSLAMAFGGSVPVWAENLNNQKLTKGDWNLQESCRWNTARSQRIRSPWMAQPSLQEMLLCP